MSSQTSDREHRVSIVVPVYRGGSALADLVAELSAFHDEQVTTDGHTFRVVEILLVHDHGPPGPDRLIRELAEKYETVRPVWLSRNFGQHAATLAGMASSGGDWIVTMDEDGQHDPAHIADLLNTAMRERASLVYAAPTNTPPHRAWRNATSRGAKKVVTALFGTTQASEFHSFRLVVGELGRGVAAFAGPGVYLDVALGWITNDVATCPLTMRQEGQTRSSYTPRKLLSHFWRMVLTSGTRPLRIVSIAGATFAVLGLLIAVGLTVARLSGNVGVPGWTSVMMVSLIGSGVTLFAMGVVAEYLGLAVNMAMGKPLYLIVGDPEKGPIGRGRPDAE
jgi:hypothetical protein